MPREVYTVALCRLVSDMGDEMAMIALLFRVKDLGPLAVSGLFACGAVSRVVMSPLAGAIVDKFATRPLVRRVSLLQGALCAVLALVHGWLVYPFVVLLSVGATVVKPAWQAYLPTLVTESDLPRLYATLQTYVSLAMVAGSGLGGLVVGLFGVPTSLLIDAGTFMFVGGMTLSLRVERTPKGAVRGASGLWTGFTAIFGSRVLFAMFVLLTMFNMCAGAVEVMGVFLVTEILNGGPKSFGAVSLAFGASMFVVGRILSVRTLRWDKTSLVVASAMVAAAGIVMFGLAPSVWVAGAAMVVNGIGLAGLNIYAMPIMVEHSKDEERGRIFAASSALTTMGFVVSLMINGLAGSTFSARSVIVAAGVVCLMVTAWNGTRVRRAVVARSVPAN